MKLLKKYSSILGGCLLVALSLNIFYKGRNLVPSGIFGFAILYNGKVGMDLALIVLLLNVFFFVGAILFVDKDHLKRMILPFLVIPLFIYLTKDIVAILDMGDVDKMLLSLYGGILIGLGFRLIYKNREYASGADVIMLISKEISRSKRFIANYFLDMLWVIIAIYSYGFEVAMYSCLSIIIIEIISKRATLGVSDAKVFYIITKCEKEIRSYIIDELGYELTIFDVKGGFLKTKNKVLMCAIPTKDYYKLKEGVKVIDPHAFITITDSYEVINSNRSLKTNLDKE